MVYKERSYKEKDFQEVGLSPAGCSTRLVAPTKKPLEW